MAGRLSNDTSDAFRVARVVCILFMMTVHVWPGATEIIANASSPVFYQIVIGYFGRSSVPLLGIISGYLFWYLQSEKEVDAHKIVTRKINSLMLPMVLWSAILLAIFVLYFLFTGDNRGLPESTIGWINSLFAVTQEPFNRPLGFLRDVFFSVLIGIGAWKLHRRWPISSFVGLLLLVVFELAADGILFLRPTVFAFFTLGIIIARMGWLQSMPGWGAVGVLLAADLVVRELLVIPSGYYVDLCLNLFHRLTVALFMWNLCCLLVQRVPSIADAIKWLEPSIFFIFCSHMVTIVFMAYVAQKAGVDVSRSEYIVFFLLQLVVVVLAAVCARWVMVRYTPRLLRLLAGGRI